MTYDKMTELASEISNTCLQNISKANLSLFRICENVCDNIEAFYSELWANLEEYEQDDKEGEE